jgi:hypothetical protein
MAGEYRAALVAHALEGDPWRALADALEYAAGVIAGPVVDAFPSMTPGTWLAMDCVRSESAARRGRCACDFCTWETRNRKRVDDWRRADAMRPQPQKPRPFGSDADAVEQAVAYARDGASAPSYLGPMLDRTRDEASLGLRMARSTGSGSRDPAGLYHAGLRVDVWRAYTVACSRDEVRQGATTAAAIRCAMAYAVGVPCEDAALARRSRRAARVELAARGLIPDPPLRAGRMLAEVEARRAVLAATSR